MNLNTLLLLLFHCYLPCLFSQGPQAYPTGAEFVSGLHASTGFNYRKGEFIIRSFEIFQRGIHVGLSDHFSIGAGLNFDAVYGHAKATVDIGEFVHLGTGVLLFTSSDLMENGLLGAFGSITVGNRDYYVNASLIRARNLVGGKSSSLLPYAIGAAFRISKGMGISMEYVQYSWDTIALDQAKFQSISGIWVNAFRPALKFSIGLARLNNLDRICLYEDCTTGAWPYILIGNFAYQLHPKKSK